MEESQTLMSARIRFIDTQLSLVHIALEHYEHCLQSILKVLLSPSSESNGTHDTSSETATSWANQHGFLNVSITPVECSIVCSKDLAQQVFGSNSTPGHTTISSDDFVVISVEGDDLEAGKRVLELSSPLALAGISIFFITTYFSDYILVPAKSRGHVIRALEERGFTFEESTEAYVNPAAQHHRNKSSTSSFGVGSPTTPPPKTVSELQNRTCALLKRHNITPNVDSDIRLIQCSGRQDDPRSHLMDKLTLQLGLTKCLIHQPKFLSLTLTKDDKASLLLEKSQASHFGSDNVLLGSKDDYLIPITLDLEPLPFEATGIVCGVAAMLACRDESSSFLEPIEMSYLSTARGSTVMVEEKDLERAIEALELGQRGTVVD